MRSISWWPTPRSWFTYTPKMPYLQLVTSALIAPGLSCMWTISGSDAEVKVQPESVIRNMRLLHMLVPMVFVVLAAVLVAFYPLSEKRIRQLQTDLHGTEI